MHAHASRIRPSSIEETGNTCLDTSLFYFLLLLIFLHTLTSHNHRAFTSFSVQPLYLLFLFFVLHYLTFAFYLTTTTTTASCTFVCKMSFNKSNAANFTLSLLNINVSVKYKIILVWYIKAATSRFLHIFKYTCDTRCDIIILHTTSTRINVK